MAEAGARNDPYVAFRFEVRLTGVAVAGFSECSGLRLETEAYAYAEGGQNSFERKFPSRSKQSNLTLKRGIVDRVMWDWYDDLARDGVALRRDGSVVMRDPSGGQVVAEWRFFRAWPTKWEGPDLNASQNNVAVETVELAFEGLDRAR